MPNWDNKPNPGSTLAKELGCTCPASENNHGEHPPFPPYGWNVQERCPLHSTNWQRVLEDSIGWLGYNPKPAQEPAPKPLWS